MKDLYKDRAAVVYGPEVTTATNSEYLRGVFRKKHVVPFPSRHYTPARDELVLTLIPGDVDHRHCLLASYAEVMALR